MFSKGYDSFLRLLVQARKRTGLTQAGLAARLGRPQSYVSKYEHGERRIDIIEFLEIAEATKIDPGTFITDLRRRMKKDRH